MQVQRRVSFVANKRADLERQPEGCLYSIHANSQTGLAFQQFLALLEPLLFQCQSSLSFFQLRCRLVALAYRLLNPLLGIFDRSDCLLV